MTKLMITLSLFFVTACACKNQDIVELKVVIPTDKYLNCTHLERELNYAQFEIQANLSRMEVFATYSNNPTCIANAALQLQRAKNKAENRVLYIKSLMKQKNCDESKHLTPK